MKLNFLVILGAIILFYSPLEAQYNAGNILLPTVNRGSNGKCKVYKQWKPSKKFKKRNPNFLYNGGYALNLSNKTVKKCNNNKRTISQLYTTNRSSNIFPAVYVESNKTLKLNGNINIILKCKDNIGFPVGKKSGLLNNAYELGLKINKKYVKKVGLRKDIIGSSDDLARDYNKLNIFYKDEMGHICASKIQGNYTIADLGDVNQCH